MKTALGSHPQSWGQKNSMVQKPTKSIKNDPNMPPSKRFRSSTKKNPPCNHPQSWREQKSWSKNSSHLYRMTLKRISSSHFDNWKKNYQYVGDINRCPFMTLQCNNYAPIYPFGHPWSQKDKIFTEKIVEDVKPISELIEHLKLP